MPSDAEIGLRGDAEIGLRGEYFSLFDLTCACRVPIFATDFRRRKKARSNCFESYFMAYLEQTSTETLAKIQQSVW